MNRKNTFANLIQQRILMLLAFWIALIIPTSSAIAQTSPGGLPGLTAWFKGNQGVIGTTTVSGWSDQSGTTNFAANTPSQTTASLQPSYNTTSTLFNFNPYITFSGLNNSFLFTPSPISTSTVNLRDVAGKKASVYVVARSQDSNDGVFFDHGGDGNDNFILTNTRGTVGSGSDVFIPTVSRTNDLVIYSMNRPGSNVGYIYINGKGVISGAQNNGTANANTRFTIGGNDINGDEFVGDIAEIVIFNTDHTLNNSDYTAKDKVESYLALKYGLTKTNNYIDSDGSVFWNQTISVSSAAYNNNIFGIGRDNASGLHQKVSKSYTSSGLVVAKTNDFISSNSASTRGSIINDKAFLMFGDNNNISTVLQNLSSSTCPASDPNADVKRISRVWLVQKTGTPGSVFLNVDLSTYAINSKVFMLVADDENFTSNVQKVSGVYKDGKATFAYEFTANKYITFGGEFDTTICPACENGVFKIKTATVWWDNRLGSTGTWASNKFGPYSVSTTGSGNVNATLEIIDPGIAEWNPQYRPWVYGRKYLWLRRWNSPNSVETYQVTLNQKAKSTFNITGINAYLGVDEVVVKGYCETGVVTPKLTYLQSKAASRSLSINGNTATGTKWWGGGAGNNGGIRVEFDRPINRITVEWKYTGGDRTHTSSLFIGDMTFECPAVLLPNADAFYVQARLEDNDIPSCQDAEIKLTFTNENCDPRIVNLSNTLPSGLTYVANSYDDSSLPSGSIQPVYSSQNFNITGLTVPPGQYNVYVKVKASASGIYNIQGNYTITNTANSYYTIGDAYTGVKGDTTVLTVRASTPLAKPDTMYMSVNKSCYTVGDTLTYTVSFNNTTGINIPKVKFENFVDSTKLRILEGSLNTTLGGTANSYEGSSYLTIDDMSIPTGGSSLSYKVIVLALATDTLANQASILVDPTSECGGESASLTTDPLYLLKCTDCAKPTGIGINGSSSQTQQFCTNSTIILQASCASGSTITWYKVGTSNVKIGTGSPLTQTFTETTTYGAACEKEGCLPVFDNTNKITATAYPTVAAPTNTVSSAGTTAICVGASTTLSATCATGTTVVWYIGTDEATTGSPVTVSPTSTTTYTAKCKSITTSCESTPTSANDIVVTVSPLVQSPQNISSSAGNTICAGISTNLSATCGSGSTVVWYSAGVLIATGSPLAIQPLTTTTYTATCQSSTGICESTPSTITVEVSSCIVQAPVIEPSTVVAGQSATFTATGCLDGTITWYKNGDLISGITGSSYGPITPAGGDKYTAKCTVNSIISPSSNEISVLPTSPIVSTNPDPVVAGQQVTFSATGCSGGTITWYKNNVLISNSNGESYGPITAVSGDSYTAVCTINGVPSSQSTPVVVPTLTNGLINVKVFLQGAFNTTTNTMTKALNTQNLIPLTDPYNLGATTTSTVLTTNEITDWVRVELRTGTNGATIQESIAALVAVDGSLYNPDGTTPLKFQTTSGNYYVAIRHRNHLGIMTASTITLSSTVPVVDFTSPTTSTFGTNGSATIGSIKALWAGNATGLTVAGTDNIRYSSGDINAVTGYLTTQTGSAGGVKVSVYSKEDTNLDGVVRYSGATRDILPINNTILTHLGNTLQTLGFIVAQTF